jgi:hypothetical protein
LNSNVAHPLVDQLRFTRSEWLRGLRGGTEADALKRLEPTNSIGWIVGHLGWQEQRYFIARPQGQLPFPEIDERMASGKPASTPSLRPMLDAWKTITKAADTWLETLTTDALLQPLPPPGFKRTAGDAIHRVTYHYWFHIGEIQAIRQALGHRRLPQFVGDIETRAPYTPESR